MPQIVLLEGALETAKDTPLASENHESSMPSPAQADTFGGGGGEGWGDYHVRNPFDSACLCVHARKIRVMVFLVSRIHSSACLCVRVCACDILVTCYRSLRVCSFCIASHGVWVHPSKPL